MFKCSSVQVCGVAHVLLHVLPMCSCISHIASTPLPPNLSPALSPPLPPPFPPPSHLWGQVSIGGVTNFGSASSPVLVR